MYYCVCSNLIIDVFKSIKHYYKYMQPTTHSIWRITNNISKKTHRCFYSQPCWSPSGSRSPCPSGMRQAVHSALYSSSVPMPVPVQNQTYFANILSRRRSRSSSKGDTNHNAYFFAFNINPYVVFIMYMRNEKPYQSIYLIIIQLSSWDVVP